MNPLTLEAYLAKLYTNTEARGTFLANPIGAARDAGLSAADAESLRHIDQAGLRMAAASYAHKREQHRRRKKSLYAFLISWWRRRLAR